VIPFVNLRLQYESIQTEVDQAIQDVFTKSQFIGGDFVKKFEEEFSTLLGVGHCIGTGNGTDSLFLILKALRIGSGDEVITPAFSCLPSAECISLTGATVVFADVDDQYYTIDVADVERKITSRTKAVIAVHLYGQAAPVEQLKKLCDKHKIYLVEDCAQAHLTKEKERFAGTFGIASAFSFYPTKNLGAYGDAGCVLTQDKIVDENVRRLANHGALKKHDHVIEGTNSRLDTLQAAILSVKLKYLRKWNEQRKAIADQYTNSLTNISQLTLPAVAPESEHTFHIYAVRTAKRDALKNQLNKVGIETLIHYPQALPFTEAYRYKNHSFTDFPVSAKLQNEVLSLPVFPGLSNTEVTTIVDNIRNYFLD